MAAHKALHYMSIANIRATVTDIFGGVEGLKNATEEAADLIPVGGRKAKLRSFHKERLKRYYRTKDYWEFWDENYWNPGPFRNRNRNNMFVSLFSSVLSFIYIAIFIILTINGNLRFAQDETNFRTVAKLNFDLCHVHLLNILGCIWLAISTFYIIGYAQGGFMIGWLIGRSLLWLNSARNFKLFLHRPYAYVLYNPLNPEWRWLYTSSSISFWITTVYWTVQLVVWVYEWAIVAAYIYFISLKAPVMTANVPEALYRVNDAMMTTPCDPHRDYELLQPTTELYKNPKNKKIFGHPQKMTLQDDNRAQIYP